jgi:hypothetical protein
MYLKTERTGRKMQENNLIVNSSPSKTFFIDMITKDVSVESAILDLIDNAIDSHKKHKKRGEKSKIQITLDLKNDYFSIEDNCGGMTKEDAVNKAFKFGNNESRSAGALGMYGIGMKRSIFKIGSDFEVQSKTDSDSFIVYMNKDEWLTLIDPMTKEDIWKFYIEDRDYEFEPGVRIHISNLSEALKTYLKWAKNISDLKEKIASAYRDILNQDVIIQLNGEIVVYTHETLYESTFIRSYVRSYDIRDLKIKIIAGMGTASPKEAGWNVVCNGRTIIERDRSELTGWETSYSSEDEGDLDFKLVNSEKTLPAFHNDFARFRGYVYIISDDANELPLNTTKDGIDKQHPIYEFIYSEMVNIMHKMLPELRRFQEVIRACKRDFKVPPTESLKPVSLSELYKENKRDFLFNLDDFKTIDKRKSVPMYIDEIVVKQLKQYFEVDTNKALGEAMYKFVMGRVNIDE